MVLAIVLLNENRLDEAEKSAREAVPLPDPSSKKALFVLADIHSAKGDFRSQAQDLENYLKLEPSDPNKKSIQVVFGVAKGLAAKDAGKN